MKCLREVLGVGEMDTVRNRRYKIKIWEKASLLERVDQSSLRWFSHIKKIYEGRLTKRIYCSVIVGINENPGGLMGKQGM